jgi:hypothetical protein
MIKDETIKDILARNGTVAVVGASDREGRPVDRVGRYLIDAGFNVIPVHPKRQGVWGLTTYPRLAEVPEPVDIVNLFRAREYCPDHARETLDMDPLPRVFWMQQGIMSPQARAILEPEGVLVVENNCIMVEHRGMGL